MTVHRAKHVVLMALAFLLGVVLFYGALGLVTAGRAMWRHRLYVAGLLAGLLGSVFRPGPWV